MTNASNLPRNKRPYGRIMLLIAFAAAGAWGMWHSATPVLRWMYELFNRDERTTLTEQQLAAQKAIFESFSGVVLPMALLGALVGAILGNVVVKSIERSATAWDRMHAGDKTTLVLGFFSGLIAAVPFLLLFQNLNVDPGYALLGMIGLTLGFATVAVYALQSMSDILPWSSARAKGKRTGIKILDTNVIIDGRIYDVVRAGFLDGQLYVPGFVLDELQHIADSHDPLRRQRGRRGLDVLRHMQADFNLEVRLHDKLAPEGGDGVDSRLVRLARAIGGDIVTNDFNLNRVAGLQEVRVLSLNDLALALRSNVMPQETMSLTINREGNQLGQGVGYLEDGTMVVVEGGKGHVGETVQVVVTQVIQTERGKMIFAELESEHSLSNGPGKVQPGSRK